MKTRPTPHLLTTSLSLLLMACGESAPSGPEPPAPLVLDCSFGDGEGAPATCLTPKQAPEHYVDQAQKYFDTLDASADPNNVPTYSDLSARWEWPPWLKLTGYERQMLLDTNKLVTKKDPSTIPTRECKAFSVQPFARCRVTFEYEGGPCAIYEEFTFNDQGEMTFIEAWTDAPSLLPMKDASDRWGEGPGVHRLSTKIPGLGNATGRIDPKGTWMSQIAAQDEEVADFAMRAQDFWHYWFDELAKVEGDLYAKGCGW
jgi:hypothetical protein